ncbi:MAG: YciI family protein [Acidimicrobiales bacterium]
MLLMNYGGAECAPMTEWTPDEITAHIDFQHRLGAELVERGELVDSQGLAPPERARFVVADGVAAPVITEGPFAGSGDLLAGYWIVDVETAARAVEIAATASAAPGPGGAPIRQPIEVREVMSAPTVEP